VSPLDRLLIGSLLIVGALFAGVHELHRYGAAQYQAGHAAAIAERAQADTKAVRARVADNKAVATQQAADNATITKEKDDEIADLRQRLAAAGRLHVGTAVCPDRPAAPAQTESAARGDGTDPSAGLVSAAADRDFKQLISDVEQDLATGRACQAFVQKNGLVP
jgi:prophage endopeptidase